MTGERGARESSTLPERQNASQVDRVKMSDFAIGSSNQAVDDAAVNVGQAKVAALKSVGQLRVIEPQQSQDGRVQVVNVNLILRDVEAEFVGLADRDSG